MKLREALDLTRIATRREKNIVYMATSMAIYWEQTKAKIVVASGELDSSYIKEIINKEDWRPFGYAE